MNTSTKKALANVVTGVGLAVSIEFLCRQHDKRTERRLKEYVDKKFAAMSKVEENEEEKSDEA